MVFLFRGRWGGSVQPGSPFPRSKSNVLFRVSDGNVTIRFFGRAQWICPLFAQKHRGLDGPHRLAKVLVASDFNQVWTLSHLFSRSRKERALFFGGGGCWSGDWILFGQMIGDDRNICVFLFIPVMKHIIPSAKRFFRTLFRPYGTESPTAQTANSIISCADFGTSRAQRAPEGLDSHFDCPIHATTDRRGPDLDRPVSGSVAPGPLGDPGFLGPRLSLTRVFWKSWAMPLGKEVGQVDGLVRLVDAQAGHAQALGNHRPTLAKRKAKEESRFGLAAPVL